MLLTALSRVPMPGCLIARTHLKLAAGTQASVQMLLLQRQLLPWLGLQGGTRLAAGASEVAPLGAVSHLHGTARLLELVSAAEPFSSVEVCHTEHVQPQLRVGLRPHEPPACLGGTHSAPLVQS